MVNKETQAPSEVQKCEASILPYASIHPTAWNINSANFAFWAFSEVCSLPGDVHLVRVGCNRSGRRWGYALRASKVNVCSALDGRLPYS
jgi:hypothetical protein